MSAWSNSTTEQTFDYTDASGQAWRLKISPGSGNQLAQLFRLGSTSDLYDYVDAAAKSRSEDKRQAARDRFDAEFYDTVLAKEKCGLNTQQLKVGDRFNVKRDKCKVTDLDPDTDELTADCTPKVGRQKLPDNSPFNPKRCVIEG